MAGEAILEKDGVVGVVPGAVQAEFGKRPLSKEANAELKALEADIVAAASGTSAAKHPAPAAPMAQVPQTAPVSEAPAPVAPVAPVAPQAIPEKFRNPDGSLNQDALNASAAQAQAKLQEAQNVSVDEYLALEKKMTLERQQAAALASQASLQQFAPPQPQVPQGYPSPVQPQQDFIAQLNKDIAANPAQALLNMQQAALQVSQEQFQSIQKRMELQELAKRDPGVFTQQGLQELAQVRAANPWIDMAPNPWSVAYEVSGRKHRVQAQPQSRPVAPALPGNQAPPVAQTYQAAPPILDAATLLNAVKNQVGASNFKAQHETLENLINAAARRAGGA